MIKIGTRMSWKFWDWRHEVNEVNVLRKSRLGLGYEINLLMPKHPTRCDEIYISGVIFRRVWPPIKPKPMYCGLCKQAPCKYLAPVMGSPTP